ncbi:MAG: hypothetical protein ACI9U0_000290 [Flavobacteriales bacterium]|jgi:hypothetical protein|tara:strand:- start:4836 stop:5144 length:309 start_codon:yes stop_codon:yes gene_type:complete
MITLSITTAVDESIENDWLDYMKTDHISLLMKTELFKDFRLVRIIPGQGVDLSYNLQLRLEGHKELNEFRSQHEATFVNLEGKRFGGKYAVFHSVLEHELEG